MVAALIGASVGILTIVVARLVRGERWMYAIGLLTLPSLYASFALRVGQPSLGLKEMIVGLPFLVVGVALGAVGVRHSAIVVGVFWILHGLYDLVHARLVANPGVPAWYPAFCFTVDVVVGAYVLWLARRIPEGNLRRA